MAKQATPLTPARVRNSPEGMYADGNGLYLVVEASGARRWIVRVQVKGMLTSGGKPKRMEIGLGNTDLVSLDEARGKALEMKRMGRKGINPIQADNSRLPSFEDVARNWFEQNKSNWSNGKHVQQWINTLEKYVFPHIGGIRVDLVDQSHVLQCVEPIWNSKRETARRVMQRISKVLDVARAKQFRAGENPVEVIKRANVLTSANNAQVKSHAALPWADLPEFWSDLVQRDDTSAYALQFTILTAARTSETLGATWDEIDLEARTWAIPAGRMKAKREHVVPLCSSADALLQRLHNTKRYDFIFEGQKSGRPLSNMAMAQLLKRMGRTDITVHGFRSSFRDWCGDNGIERELAELSLAHSLGNAVEQAYARSPLTDRRREVMERWAHFVCGN